MSAVCAGPGRVAESLGMTRLEGSWVQKGVGGRRAGTGRHVVKPLARRPGLAVGPGRLPGGATWPLVDHQGSGLRELQPLAGP